MFRPSEGQLSFLRNALEYAVSTWPSYEGTDEASISFYRDSMRDGLDRVSYSLWHPLGAFTDFNLGIITMLSL